MKQTDNIGNIAGKFQMFLLTLSPHSWIYKDKPTSAEHCSIDRLLNFPLECMVGITVQASGDEGVKEDRTKTNH